MTTTSASKHDMSREAAIGWFIALLGCTAFLAFFDLGGGPPLSGTECWVAQTSREMLQHSDWLRPVFSGELRLQKSVGPYWATMLIAKLRGSGVDAFSVRTQSALATLLLVLVVFELTRSIGGVRRALFAGFALTSSAFIFDWSHSGAADLALAAWCTLSVGALWIAFEAESNTTRAVIFLLLGYLAAGMGMLQKMPMPLACVGGPALCYLVFWKRWRVLLNKWHVVGLLLFLLPWAPWVVYMLLYEPAALDRWKVEFFDRFTGDLPNLNENSGRGDYFFYLLVPFVYTIPYVFCLPGAIVRAFQKNIDPDVNQSGLRFMIAWFLSQLVIFTAAAGKETRYFLPAIPPLFVLLGCHLPVFYDSVTVRSREFLRRTSIVVIVMVIGGSIAIGFVLVRSKSLAAIADWRTVWPGYVAICTIVMAGTVVSAFCFARRRGVAAFATLAATMCTAWMCAWTMFLPAVRGVPYDLDFAEQLRDRLPVADRDKIYQIGHQSPTIVWHSDVRFPRLIDPVKLIEMEHGQRNLQHEVELIGKEMIRRLCGHDLVLFVIKRRDYLRFIWEGARFVEANQEFPKTYLWLQSRVGGSKRQTLLIGNHPPPWKEELYPPAKLP